MNWNSGLNWLVINELIEEKYSSPSSRNWSVHITMWSLASLPFAKTDPLFRHYQVPQYQILVALKAYWMVDPLDFTRIALQRCQSLHRCVTTKYIKYQLSVAPKAYWMVDPLDFTRIALPRCQSLYRCVCLAAGYISTMIRRQNVVAFSLSAHRLYTDICPRSNTSVWGYCNAPCDAVARTEEGWRSSKISWARWLGITGLRPLELGLCPWFSTNLRWKLGSDPRFSARFFSCWQNGHYDETVACNWLVRSSTGCLAGSARVPWHKVVWECGGDTQLVRCHAQLRLWDEVLSKSLKAGLVACFPSCHAVGLIYTPIWQV